MNVTDEVLDKAVLRAVADDYEDFETLIVETRAEHDALIASLDRLVRGRLINAYTYNQDLRHFVSIDRVDPSLFYYATDYGRAFIDNLSP
jgi:hypothetical protein